MGLWSWISFWGWSLLICAYICTYVIKICLAVLTVFMAGVIRQGERCQSIRVLRSAEVFWAVARVSFNFKHFLYLGSLATAIDVLLFQSLTRNFSRRRRLNFLFMGNMSPYYFKTIFTLCMKCIPSFIKIGGVVSEKKRDNGQTFVVLYIGYCKIFFMFKTKCC